MLGSGRASLFGAASLVQRPGIEQRLQGLDLKSDLRHLFAVGLGRRRDPRGVSLGGRTVTLLGGIPASLQLLLQVLAVVDLALAFGGSVEGEFDVAGGHVDEVQQVGRVLALLQVLLQGSLVLPATLRAIHVGFEQQRKRGQHGCVTDCTLTISAQLNDATRVGFAFSCQHSRSCFTPTADACSVFQTAKQLQSVSQTRAICNAEAPSEIGNHSRIQLSSGILFCKHTMSNRSFPLFCFAAPAVY